MEAFPFLSISPLYFLFALNGPRMSVQPMERKSLAVTACLLVPVNEAARGGGRQGIGVDQRISAYIPQCLWRV